MRSVALLFSLLFLMNAEAQIINGKILPTNNNITIVKVWGTHDERGYAQGRLLAARIDALYRNYIVAKFGVALAYAKSVLMDSLNFSIDSRYTEEAKGVVRGMADAGYSGYDYSDLLLANALLDLSSMLSAEFNININLGCSSLMSWGDATAGTALNGKAVMSRNLDWEVNSYLNNNQVMVIHLPSETNEQPWIMIGFAGQISSLSGTNKSGVSAFQHVLSGVSGHAATGKKYTPIWFAIRRGLETNDINGDGYNNTNDLRHSLLLSQNGAAPNCIVTVGASAANQHDSLIAMVAEVTNTAPYHSFRTNSYDDKIPGDNLYAANSAICRNDARQYCTRYNSLTSAIGTGLDIDSLKNWTLLRDYSRVVGTNIQMMQIVPELNILKLSVYTGAPAYNSNPFTYNLDTLYETPVAVSPDLFIPVDEISLVQNHPNPFNGTTKIRLIIPQGMQATEAAPVKLIITDILGREAATLVDRALRAGSYDFEFNSGALTSGIYLCILKTGNKVLTRKMTLLK